MRKSEPPPARSRRLGVARVLSKAGLCSRSEAARWVAGEGARPQPRTLFVPHPGDIHLLVTDVVMPEMNGRDLARKILSLYPGIKRLFMSGYTADVIVHQGVLDEGVHFISKPFSVKGLADKVRETLG